MKSPLLIVLFIFCGFLSYSQQGIYWINKHDQTRSAPSSNTNKSNLIGDSPTEDSEEDSVEPKDFGALPSLTSLLGKREIVPDIELLANKKFEGSAFYGETKIFIATKGETNNAEENTGSLFITQTSNFGFVLNFSKGFNINEAGSNPRTFLNLNMNYLGKEMRPDSVTSFTVGALHGKIGLEQILVKNALSFYINLNGLVFTDNVDQFEQYYNYKKKLNGFIDSGIKAILNLAGESISDLYLFADMNFIWNGGDVNRYYNSSDLVIPALRIGIQKDFGLR